jgi:hypothetical protein
MTRQQQDGGSSNRRLCANRLEGRFRPGRCRAAWGLCWAAMIAGCGGGPAGSRSTALAPDGGTSGSSSMGLAPDGGTSDSSSTVLVQDGASSEGKSIASAAEASSAEAGTGAGETGASNRAGQCGEKMNLSLASTGAGTCQSCANGSGCGAAACIHAGNTAPTEYCAADCTTTPCGEGQSCMPDNLQVGVCAPLFDCANPVTAFPCTTRSQLDTGQDVALLASPDGGHLAVARGFMPTTGVQCASEQLPDGEVGTLAVLTVAAPASPVLVSGVTWPSVTFSPDGQYIAYVTGVTDLCAGSGTLIVAKADGSAPRAVATGQYGSTFFLAGDYIVYEIADPKNPCAFAATPLAGGAIETFSSPFCTPGNIFNSVVPDPAGSAFLFGDQVAGFPNGERPVDAAAQAADPGLYFYGGGVNLARLASGTVDTFNPYESRFAWSPDGSAVAIDVDALNAAFAGTGTGFVTVATVSGDTPDVTAECQCAVTPAFSPDSAHVVWDVAADTGQTIASAAALQTVGGAGTTILGLPGSGVTQLGFTPDGQNVFAVDAGLLLLAPLTSTSMFTTLVQDVSGGFVFAPSSDRVAVWKKTPGEIDVYALTGGAAVAVAVPAGAMNTNLSGAFEYEPVSDRPALLLTGETIPTGESFAELASTDGASALLEANLGNTAAFGWIGRVAVFTISSTIVRTSIGDVVAGSIDLGGIADDGSAGGTLARNVTSTANVNNQLFYLRSDQPGVWTVPIPQPAD